MKSASRRIIITKDGSQTIEISGINATYHSRHGAIRESNHVFIEAGLQYVRHTFTQQTIRVFEMGFGTGLNALLTAVKAANEKWHIHYTAVEKYPVPIEDAMQLNYTSLLDHEPLFKRLHTCEWDQPHRIDPYFMFAKHHTDLIDYSTTEPFHLIYYDAFAPAAQPELWTETIFIKMYNMLLPGGVLVTYCSKGDVRRAMMAAGFQVEKVAGPPGKREILRAVRT